MTVNTFIKVRRGCIKKPSKKLSDTIEELRRKVATLTKIINNNFFKINIYISSGHELIIGPELIYFR